ncbi:HD domain-containing phosphohydrolase [Marinitoga litoralis]|uniref:HD domain-containing phosphohydrolase n=1 Tax=Marinitoga litoralis TaxID=570855 RepID=UPI001961C132|nr:HD domain-containing phosphohydrolase [Marinitoga litoralis]MBM7559367.1 HD-GYP domain-containing protein (c-di-GMP phosphodiesterase class II)/ABC-type amino acid transport substrate-binding protein [Marinitoga litoralis]
MKKTLLILIIFILSFSSYAEKLIVGVYDNKPLTYIEDNQYTGFAVDLLKEIAKREKWELDFKYDSFSNLLSDIYANNIDLIIAMGKNEERENFVIFPQEHFFTNWGIVYSNKKIDSILGLNNTKIAVLKGDIYYNKFENLSKEFEVSIEFLEFDSYDDVLKSVKNNISDAGIVNRIYSGNTYKLYKTPIVFSPLEVYYGFSKNTKKEIIDKVDNYLNTWKYDEKSPYNTLFNKYILESTIPNWIRDLLVFLPIISITFFVTALIYYLLFKKTLSNLFKKNNELDAYVNELNAVNEELEENYHEIENLNFKIIHLIKMISNLKISSPLDVFYNDLLKTAINLIPEADYGSIIYINSKNNTWKFLSAYGHDFELLKNIEYAAGHIPVKEKIRIVDNNIVENEKIEMDDKSYEILKKASKPIKKTIIYEIQLNEEEWINFCLDIDANSDKSFSNESKELLEIFGNLAKAFWIEKLSYEHIKKSYTNLSNKLALIVEEYDDITGGHIYRVAKYSKFIAEKLELEPNLINEIETYAPLHDIGKILIDKSILLKNSKLTDEEWEEMKKHTIYGAKILEEEYFKTARNIALYHHEKYDGTGYPYGLKGDEIPIEAQIVAFADVYDALRSDRPYKKGYSHEKVVEIILNGDNRTRPEHFNPKILEIFNNYHETFKNIFESFL